MAAEPPSFVGRDSRDLAALDVALARLSSDFWFDVDHNEGDNALDFFIDRDPVYQIQDQVFAGAEAIKAFYDWRKGRGPRVARHCITNVRTFRRSDGSAGMTSILLLFAADGVPVLPSSSPIMIADVEDHCELQDRTWRYKSKRLTTMFAGGVPITVPVNAGGLAGSGST